jgi:hypothetical protein
MRALPPASGGLRGATVGAAPVEVEPRVVDLEAEVGRDPLRDRHDVPLADLLDPAAAVTGEMMVVLRAAGHVAVDVTALLETAGHPGAHERLEGPEDGGAPDPRVDPPEAIVEVLGRDLPAVRGQGIGHEQALARDPLAGGGEPIGGGGRIEHGRSHQRRG